MKGKNKVWPIAGDMFRDWFLNPVRVPGIRHGTI